MYKWIANDNSEHWKYHVIFYFQESYFLNDDVKTLIVKFLKQYYDIYDSDNRQPLMAAYHDKVGTACIRIRDVTTHSQVNFDLRSATSCFEKFY